jgi:hypothetical protein
VAALRALPRAIDIVALRATNAALFFPILSILSAAQQPFYRPLQRFTIPNKTLRIVLPQCAGGIIFHGNLPKRKLFFVKFSQNSLSLLSKLRKRTCSL